MNLNLTLFGEAITFAIFIWFTMKFVWPMLMTAISDRQKTIADGLAAAARGQEELSQAQLQVTEQLKQAKDKANAFIQQAELRAQQVLDEAKLQAKTEAERIIANAQAEIEREITQAKQALQAQMASIVVKGAEQLLRSNINEQNNAQLLSELAKEI